MTTCTSVSVYACMCVRVFYVRVQEPVRLSMNTHVPCVCSHTRVFVAPHTAAVQGTPRMLKVTGCSVDVVVGIPIPGSPSLSVSCSQAYMEHLVHAGP